MSFSSFDVRIRLAVQHFWSTRQSQSKRQGQTTGVRDAGMRAAVTGGAQMDGFLSLARELMVDAGVPSSNIHVKNRMELPGWFRPEKSWDLIVMLNGRLVASIEFKSHIGPSFGNNFNNRAEEAIGSASDLWAAYREGAFAPSARPWLGYFMLLEETPGSTRMVRPREPHYRVFPEFREASYARRYEVMLTKLLRERLYDGACLMLSDAESGVQGNYREPAPELAFARFAESLAARATAAARAG